MSDFEEYKRHMEDALMNQEISEEEFMELFPPPMEDSTDIPF